LTYDASLDMLLPLCTCSVKQSKPTEFHLV